MAVLFGKYLPRHGIEIDLVAGAAPGAAKSAEWAGGSVFLCKLPATRSLQYVKVLWHGIRRMFAARKEDYDLIQVRDMPVAASFAILAGKFRKVPVAYWMSYPMPEGQIALAKARGLTTGAMKFLFPWISGQIGKLLLYRWVLPNASHVFVQSRTMKQELSDTGLPSERLTPVPMGVDFERVAQSWPLPIDMPSLKNRRALVYLGTLDRPRNIERLFDVLQSVRERHPDVALILAGDTTDTAYRKNLLDYGESLGLTQHIVFTGWVDVDLAWRYVVSADVALSPFPRGSLLDSASPTKVAEYMALKRPIVCNDNPEQKFLVEESGAGICVPYEVEPFAKAIGDLLDETESDRKTRGTLGYEFIHRHRRYEVIAQDVASIYFDVFKSPIIAPAERI